MKAFLMYRDRDFDLQQEFPPHEEALTQDLELDTLLAPWRSVTNSSLKSRRKLFCPV